MKHIILIFILIFLHVGVYSQKGNPPGTIKIDENLYFDKTELRNKDYREYVNWIERILGKDSHEYRDALIDSNIVSYNYYKNPRFNNFPLVGVSYEQAVNYCNWRSDRVYEMSLIQVGIIKPDEIQNKNHYFSIDNLLTGKIKINKPENLKKIPVPHYRLPTIKEWEHAAGLKKSDCLYIDSFKMSKHKPISEDSVGLVNVNTNEKVKPNKYGLINMIGNVSEMIDQKGIAKGCSWAEMLENCVIKNNISYTKPETWLGFRCVCEYDYNLNKLLNYEK